MRKVSIKARSEQGFWRLGRHWPAAGKSVARDEFTDGEWEVLLAEPQLIVAPIADDSTADEDTSGIDDMLKSGIQTLAAENFDAKTGKPKLSALSKALGVKVRAEDLDRVWAESLPKAE